MPFHGVDLKLTEYIFFSTAEAKKIPKKNKKKKKKKKSKKRKSNANQEDEPQEKRVCNEKK